VLSASKIIIWFIIINSSRSIFEAYPGGAEGQKIVKEKHHSMMRTEMD
jgi:hypothetical protein